jgi:hypothetical protein
MLGKKYHKTDLAHCSKSSATGAKRSKRPRKARGPAATTASATAAAAIHNRLAFPRADGRFGVAVLTTGQSPPVVRPILLYRNPSPMARSFSPELSPERNERYRGSFSWA